jgi:hypothetical protein
MHTLVKNHLPDEVIYRGKTYIRLIAEGTGEGYNNMYIVCEVLKPLKNDNL